MADDFSVDFSADEVNALLRKIQESSIFTAEEKQKLNDAINSSGVAYKALADGNGNNIPNTYQVKLSSAQLLAVNSGIDSEKVEQIATLTNSNIELVNNGPKNKFSWSASDRTHNGVTFTVNGDGTITANGTNNGSGNSFISIKIMSAQEIGEFANYILSGAPSNDIGAYLSLEERGGSYTTYVRDRGSGVVIPEIITEVNVYIVIPKNAVADNILFKPMICSESDWNISKEFQPYRPSYQELYEMVLALQGNNSTQSFLSLQDDM